MRKILLLICFVSIIIILLYANRPSWVSYSDMTQTITFSYPENWYLIDGNINSGSLHILSYDINDPSLKPHTFDKGMTKIEILRLYNPEILPKNKSIKIPGTNNDYLIITFLGDEKNRHVYNKLLETLTFIEE